MRVSKSFIDSPTVADDTAMTEDVLQHLIENLPDVVSAYPPGYFIALVRHSARLARDKFNLTEMAAIRMFVRMRWEIAAGFYKHPTIAANLSDTSMRPMDRFEALLTPELEHVWHDAMVYDGPDYWRGQNSDGFDDMVYDEAQS